MKPLYTVRVRTLIHYAEVESQTLCGVKITEAWSILTNKRSGEATCQKCKRKVRDEPRDQRPGSATTGRPGQRNATTMTDNQKRAAEARAGQTLAASGLLGGSLNMEKKLHEQIADELTVKITDLLFGTQPDAMLPMHRELVSAWLKSSGINDRLRDVIGDRYASA